jgi:hypothetical protein
MSTTVRRHNVFLKCEEADREVRAGPHAWIQWKGTNVCMDVHCSCGNLGHVDDDFAYYVRCSNCGKLWAMCANVRMIEVIAEDVEGQCEPRSTT